MHGLLQITAIWTRITTINQAMEAKYKVLTGVIHGMKAILKIREDTKNPTVANKCS